MLFVAAEFGLRHELDGCDYLMSWDGNVCRMGDRGSSSDAKDFQETLKGSPKFYHQLSLSGQLILSKLIKNFIQLIIIILTIK